MERELWPLLYRALLDVSADGRRRGARYQPWVIAAVLLWAALRDRPVSWACRPDHRDTTRVRPARVPSASTVPRRARGADAAGLLARLADRPRGAGPPGWTLAVDGKPLVVGVCSKDPDARPGWVPGGFARGYKLHAVWGGRCLPEAWAVTPLGEYEGAVAARLLAGLSGRGVLLADGNYEASRVYDAAARAGYQPLAPPDRQGTGRGHRYQSPHRAAALRWFADGLGWELLRGRGAIERAFGNLGAFGGGPGPLPAWVRRRGRVERWVWAELAINAARITYRRQQNGQMQ